jgi:hypothetical protein
MMPNLKAKILSPQEIKMIYGPSFENKKGFIIDGTIVLNHDRFDSTTVFHEFGCIILGDKDAGECTEYIPE